MMFDVMDNEWVWLIMQMIHHTLLLIDLFSNRISNSIYILYLCNIIDLSYLIR